MIQLLFVIAAVLAEKPKCHPRHHSAQPTHQPYPTATATATAYHYPAQQQPAQLPKKSLPSPVPHQYMHKAQPVVAQGLRPAPTAAPHQSYPGTVPMDQPCLNYHNNARVAKKLRPLVWDASLAASASQYAIHLQKIGYLVHSKGPYGENLYSGSHSCPNAAKMWLDERPVYGGVPLGSGNFHDYG